MAAIAPGQPPLRDRFRRDRFPARSRFTDAHAGQPPQRHIPVKLGVSRSMYLADAAFADLGGDIVVAESCADDK